MDDDFYQKLLGFALNYVSIRPRSEKEIRDYVIRKIHRLGVSESLLHKVVDRLKELGYIDDVGFSNAFISSRNRLRPKGKFLLKRELLQKGIEPDVVESVLSRLDYEEGNQVDLATKAVQKKLQGLKRYTLKERRNKLYSFLLRRGFDYDTITSVIDEVT